MEKITIQVGSFEVNCTILVEAQQAWIIDPGNEAERIIDWLTAHSVLPQAILLTHAHFDHIGGITQLQAKYPNLPIYLHPNDFPYIGDARNQFPPDYPLTKRPAQLLDCRELKLPFKLEVIETPGHTPGGVCYYLPEQQWLFSGDTLFAGSIGRTDLPGGSMGVLMDSLTQLKALPPETTVIPGHGSTTTIGHELECNMFLQ